MNDPRFRRHRHLRAVIEAVLEGRQGAMVPAEGDGPAVRLDLGCYAVLGGDAGTPLARTLLETVVPPREIVVPDDPRWRALIRDVHADAVADRSMRAYLPGPECADRVDDFAGRVPDGYKLSALSPTMAATIDDGLTPHGIGVFGGPAAFAREGLGFGLISGDVVACAATSYARSARHVEIAIATRREHRRRGLAACAASALARRVLGMGLVPHWNASNPVSQRLALRLGFEAVGTCEILMLDPGRHLQPESRLTVE